VGRPEVIFADEPTGALDTASAANLLQTLAHMCEALGQTVVMVTHDEQAAATTNRIIRLHDGRIIGDEAVRHPTSVRTKLATAPGTPSRGPIIALPIVSIVLGAAGLLSESGRSAGH